MTYPAADAIRVGRLGRCDNAPTGAGIAAVRPGATFADLFRAMNGVMGGADSGVGRLGHGLGMQLTEFPSVTAWDRTELVEGMVLTLEPGMEFSRDESGGKVMVHEENVVVRDGGAELLTVRAPRVMPVISKRRLPPP